MPATEAPTPRGTDVRIGISGWTYAPWRGTFFPAGLTQKRELEFASHQVRSIEINGTFYSLQRPSSFAKWHDETPEDFLFSVKCPRFISHMKRLKNIRIPLANFFASGVLRLNAKLGPLLWQLPPSQQFDLATLENFFNELPRSTQAAAELAGQSDWHLKTPRWVTIDENRPLRYALEVRHPSFEQPAFIDLLRKHNVALVVADTAGKWPYLEDITADLVYARLHGDEILYVSGYTEAALDRWAEKIRHWSRGANPPNAKLAGPPSPINAAPHDVYVYFDNDVKTRAPYDAMSLAHRLELGVKPAEAPPIETITEEPRTTWPGFSSKKKNSMQAKVAANGDSGRREKQSKPAVKKKTQTRPLG